MQPYLIRASPLTAGHLYPCVSWQDGWQHVEGDFKSVMAIITPCRSDQSSSGLSPYGHLADGRIQLVMVHKCSRLQYLRFLAAIPSTGNFDPFQDSKASPFYNGHQSNSYHV